MEKLRAREVHRAPGLVVIAIEAISVDNDDTGIGIWGQLTPLAVIISTAEGSRALDMAGLPLPLSRLYHALPELAPIIPAAPLSPTAVTSPQR
jgi:hypothetical protein